MDCLVSFKEAAFLDLEDVDEELLVEGEGTTPESIGSERVEVRDEKEEDIESFCCRRGISLFEMGIVIEAFSAVLFKAFWIISMVHTVCSWRFAREGDEEPPAAKLRSSSKLDSSSASNSSHLLAKDTWRSSACKFHSCLPVVNDLSREVFCCLLRRGLPDEEDEDALRLFSCLSVSDLLLPKNS